MARPIWKGVISFGLVNVPVELQTAVHDHRPRFRLLHAKDKSPVKYERICQREGKAVSWDDLVKGFEYSKGRFVTLTQDDLRTAALESSHSIDIVDFVPVDAIDNRYYATPYYVVPGSGGARGYALLRQAMMKTQRVGVGKLVLRATQHLAALTVIDEVLVLNLLRLAEDIVDHKDIDLPSVKPAPAKEVELGTMLIDKLASDWDPTKYRDDYRAKLKQLIDAKIRGEKPEAVESVEPEHTAVVDLMERLRQSLDKSAGPKRVKSRRASAPRKRRARRAAA